MENVRTILDDDAARTLGEYILRFPKPCKVTVTDEMVRTLSQNALIHKWFAEIANQTHESADQVKRECKLYQGCPILMAADPRFVEFCKNLSHLTVEEKIAAMDFVAVTSVMTTKQLGRMCDAVFRKYTEQGIILTEPVE